jgi:hypothetical protein
MPARPFHLGWFLQGSSVQTWGESWTGHVGRNWMVDLLNWPYAACLSATLLAATLAIIAAFQRLPGVRDVFRMAV